MKFLIPWHRYGLIAELASELQGKSPQFGKTSLQKMVYLLQTACKVDVGYEFDLYTYGPFSSQLLQDLDMVESLGGVQVRPVLSRLNGYRIDPADRNQVLRDRAKDFLSRPEVTEALRRLIKDLGHCSARDLELRSTIVYVFHDVGSSGHTDRNKVIQLVNEIKPKFSRQEIVDAVEELEAKRYIAFAPQAVSS